MAPKASGPILERHIIAQNEITRHATVFLIRGRKVPNAFLYAFPACFVNICWCYSDLGRCISRSGRFLASIMSFSDSEYRDHIQYSPDAMFSTFQSNLNRRRTYRFDPVCRVLRCSGSMEPAFYRGDLLFLYLDDSPLQLGDIVVYKLEGRDIPIVHRIISVHERYFKHHNDLLFRSS
jgi:hypothetical protein